jgi:hypothetical protein
MTNSCFSRYCPRDTKSLVEWAATGMNLAPGSYKSGVMRKAELLMKSCQEPNVFLILDEAFSTFERLSKNGLLTQTSVSEIMLARNPLNRVGEMLKDDW